MNSEPKPANPPKIYPYSDAPRLSADGDLCSLINVRSVFSNMPEDAEIELEIGGGRGVFALERAVAAPNACLLGFEIRRKWAAIIDKKLASLGFGARARVFAEDIRDVLPRLQPAGVLSRVYLHFPDPWWKKRHEKRLVMSERVLVELERLMRVGAEFFIQTDVVERFDQYRTLLDARPTFAPAGDVSGSPAMSDNPYGARSPREKRAIRDGLPVHRLRYVRSDVPSHANPAIGDELKPRRASEGESA